MKKRGTPFRIVGGIISALGLVFLWLCVQDTGELYEEGYCTAEESLEQLIIPLIILVICEIISVILCLHGKRIDKEDEKNAKLENEFNKLNEKMLKILQQEGNSSTNVLISKIEKLYEEGKISKEEYEDFINSSTEK